ncbi:hypothetical protein LCGC14_1600150 [marine sediment metagenome]|uniref:HNH nuclease domain-containing protein n=1 Tax=marine sediment metagenome TaxID=412755 RepID=A0A0F9IBC2_9ZZZZ
MKRSSLSHEKSRLKELLWLLIQKYQLTCPICNKPFEKSDILPSRGVDQLTEHHSDHNHQNNALFNRVLTHRVCHKSHHSKNNILFWRQFK